MVKIHHSPNSNHQKQAAFRWGDKYFYTNGIYRPLYNVFAKLEEAGADLDIIETLCGYLRVGDLLTSMFLAEKSKDKKKSLSANDIELPTLISTLLGEFILSHILHAGWGRGRKLDLWGSVFLALVTTHLRSVSGKPRARLADELLRATRRHLGFPLRTLSRDGRKRARDKIAKLRAYVADQPAGESALSRFIAREITKRRPHKPLRIASKKKYVQ